jgi:hypothetical protein
MLNPNRHPGESRDPFISGRALGRMDPGFRRDDDGKRITAGMTME